MADIWEFTKDDASGFIDWIHEHPYGYVLNLRVFAAEIRPMLHHADCGHFKGEDELEWANNTKVCGETQYVVQRWMDDNLASVEAERCHCVDSTHGGGSVWENQPWRSEVATTVSHSAQRLR